MPIVECGKLVAMEAVLPVGEEMQHYDAEGQPDQDSRVAVEDAALGARLVHVNLEGSIEPSGGFVNKTDFQEIDKHYVEPSSP